MGVFSAISVGHKVFPKFQWIQLNLKISSLTCVLLASRSQAQEVAGSNPFTTMTNVFAIEFSNSANSVKHLGKSPLLLFINWIHNLRVIGRGTEKDCSWNCHCLPVPVVLGKCARWCNGSIELTLHKTLKTLQLLTSQKRQNRYNF